MIKHKTYQNSELLEANLDLEQAFKLIEAQEYEALNILLSESQMNMSAKGVSQTWHDVSNLLSFLALSCVILDKSALWHQKAGEEASLRRQEIADSMREYLRILQASGWENVSKIIDESIRSSGNSNAQLWTKIKKLLHNTALVAQPSTIASFVSDNADSEPGKAKTLYIHPNGKYKTTTQAETKLVKQAPSHLVNQVSAEKTTLFVYGLGVFSAYHHSELITEWPSRKSKSVFKFLLLHREKAVPKELLMELFWPESEETAARNNLNVTIYNLRQALRNSHETISSVLYQDDCYFLNPDLNIWFDYEVFNAHCKRATELNYKGQAEQAIRELQAAELIYRGELFEEDRYEPWLIPHRETAHNRYIQLLEQFASKAFAQEQYMDCIHLCRTLLSVDDCLEDTHRMLMQSYMKQGQNHLAIRQYNSCVETLEEELAVLPSPDTIALYKQISAGMTKR
jgi:DNA-binding SARP family transcriptional activator